MELAPPSRPPCPHAISSQRAIHTHNAPFTLVVTGNSPHSLFPDTPIHRMSFVDDDSLSLAGLDTPNFLQLGNSFSSSLTAHCHSFRTTTTCMGDSGRRNTRESGSLHVVASEKDSCSDIFKPLPPIPQVSSFHFSAIWNLYTSSPSATDTDFSPPILTRKSTLYESSIGATDGNHAGPGFGVTEVPESPRAIYASTDPYSPWPSPVRRHFMTRSDGSFSHISRYSRPESRSGARAPDPPSRRASFVAVGCNIPGVRGARRLTRNIRLFAQRIRTLKDVLRKVHRRESAIRPTPTTPRRHRISRVSRTSSITSFVQSQSLRASTSSMLSNSLQRWLEAQNRLTLEKPFDHASITISQYERRGSWLVDGCCDAEDCDIHPSPTRESITDRSVISVHTESSMGRYASVSLRAGEEASRRRKRSSDRTDIWFISESETDPSE